MINKSYVTIKNFIKENYKYLCCILVLFLLFKIELPYKIYTPGGYVDLSNRIVVSDNSNETGKLGMAYVTMVNGNIPFLLLSYIIPNWDIVSLDDLLDDNLTLDEMMKSDKLAMEQSVDNATISAYHLAHKNISIIKEEAHIIYIDKEAQTNLQLFDIIKEVDDHQITTLDELKEIVTSKKEGDEVKLKIERDGKEEEKTAKIYNTIDGLKIGVSLATTYDYEEDPKITLKTKASESGPSGGLMMSLAIYNTLTEEDITKGKKIIGTGTIDTLGNVGEIGGVKYKLLGAAKKKCDVFLVPVDNYEEAMKVKEEHNLQISIIKVSTLEEAINKLKEM